ncbi:MAG: enoyl-CoA hydratase-related protein [Thermoanaerobaculia bacterium]
MIRVEKDGEIAVLRMDDGKANAMQERFFADLDRAFDGAAGAAAVVVAGNGKFFSGGLDLPALSAAGRAEVEKALEHLHRTMMRIFLWPAPVVCAVNGHAIAGGCVLALQGDVRLMADGAFKIGLNEVNLGVGLPVFVFETLRCQVSPALLRRIALEGMLFAPPEALDAGLIDAVVPPGDILRAAVEKARSLSEIPPGAYAQVKGLLRNSAAEAIDRAFERNSREWVELWFSSEAQGRIGEIVAKLKNRP